MKLRALNLVLFAAVLFSLVACSHDSNQEPVIGPAPILTAREQSDFDRTIHAFARTKKRWMPEEYSIKVIGAYSGVVVFSLEHRDDVSSVATVGGGKSVELHVDRKRKEVVRELGYQ